VAPLSQDPHRVSGKVRELHQGSDALIRYSRLLRRDSLRLHESGERLRARTRGEPANPQD